MRHAIFTLLAAAALVLAAVTLGQDSPVQVAQNAPAMSDDASIHGFGDSDKTCLEWTDGCRTCSRPEGGEPMCPNIGIACQPKAIACVRRPEPPKAEPEPPKAEPPKTEPAK